MEQLPIANYGIIDIDNNRRLDVLVLDNDPKNLKTYASAKGLLNYEMSDGRIVIGKVKEKGIADKLSDTIDLRWSHIGGLHPGLFYEKGSKIDNKTAKKIEDEVMTYTCDKCNEPTQYVINFMFPIMEMLGLTFVEFGGFYKEACLEHLNDVIDNKYKELKPDKLEKWRVIKHESSSIFSPSEELGMVKYNHKKHNFVPSKLPRFN